jgi:5-methylcytosine-specific restriction enzyme subunit McrC
LSKKNLIQVFEYQKLRFDSTENDFTKSHFNAMVKFNEKNDNKYYTIIHKGIKFNNYVGVIQIGGLTLEILPKADKENHEIEKQKKTWQNVLLNMLKVCNHIKVDNISETALKKRYNSILDVYLEMYLNEIEGLINSGLIKKYRRVQNNQLALKGKLVFTKNIQKNTVHKERFYCEHQVFDNNHLLHQILYKGLVILDGFIAPNLRDKLNRVLYHFSDFKKANINATHFFKIVPNRKTEPYNKAIDIAKMIILNYSPNLNSGSDNMLTLLFDMNKLWEEYVYKILNKNKPNGFSVSPQNSTKFWERKRIKPDIVIKNSIGKTIIIDTKWKIINTYKPSDDDLKQMFAYNLFWEAEKSMLLYPKVNQDDSVFGNYHHIPTEKEVNQCKIGFIEIIDKKGLRKNIDIAEEIFQKLEIGVVSN